MQLSTQLTIDSWISKDAKIKKYFYLDWSKQYKPNNNAVFLTALTEEQQTTINFREIISWRNIGQQIVLCGNISRHTYPKVKIEDEDYYTNVAFLKSHLQKAIRRKDANRAVRSALRFIRLDTNQFLRRLPIIMVEDTFLHNSFTTLVWLSCAFQTNKFKLAHNHIEYLLGVVHMMAEQQYNDFYIIQNSHNINQKYDFLAKIPKIHKEIKNEDHISLLYALQLKKAYGGMKGDMAMLNYLTDVWFDRMIAGTAITQLNTPVKTINLGKSPDIHTFELNEWILAAIDFHCSTNVVQLLMRKLEENDKYIDPNEIRRAIWNHSSSQNDHEKYCDVSEELRTATDEEIANNKKQSEETWRLIRKDYFKLAKYLLWRDR